MRNKDKREYKRWGAKRPDETIVVPVANPERRIVKAMCEKLGVSRKKFRKMQKAKRRDERKAQTPSVTKP